MAGGNAMKQTAEAKADAKEIAKYVASQTPRRVGHAHYNCIVRLCSVPVDWTPNRVGRALIDHVDGGWSPFGGRAKMVNVGELAWSVTVHTD
jgi:hypothetical protein